MQTYKLTNTDGESEEHKGNSIYDFTKTPLYINNKEIVKIEFIDRNKEKLELVQNLIEAVVYDTQTEGQNKIHNKAETESIKNLIEELLGRTPTLEEIEFVRF